MVQLALSLGSYDLADLIKLEVPLVEKNAILRFQQARIEESQ